MRNATKICITIVALLIMPDGLYADSSCRIKVLGPISDRVWYGLASGCKPIGATKDLIMVLKLDAGESDLRNCVIQESASDGGRNLNRNCDEPQGFAAFATPRSYCQKILRMMNHPRE